MFESVDKVVCSFLVLSPQSALQPFYALVHKVTHAQSVSCIGIEGLLNIVKSPVHLFVTISEHQHCPLQNRWPHQSGDAGAKNPIKNPLLL